MRELIELGVLLLALPFVGAFLLAVAAWLLWGLTLLVLRGCVSFIGGLFAGLIPEVTT